MSTRLRHGRGGVSVIPTPDATVHDHPALRRLLDLEARFVAGDPLLAPPPESRRDRSTESGPGAPSRQPSSKTGPAPVTPDPTPADRDAARPKPTKQKAPKRPRRMGYHPALDGLRAVSVVGVILYHAGFTWMHGGFFGVEVFFVVSGFLITSLLIDEKESSGTTNLAQFWLRRVRRLLPAVFAMLVAVGAWAAIAGTDEQLARLRRDFPWAIFYMGNWGQILGNVPYYVGDPPLLRHLWSLAVEEQWYLIWPLAFVALSRARLTHQRSAQLLAIVAGGAMLLMFMLHRGGSGPIQGPGVFNGVDRVNFMYLSTFTRSSGLLLGAAAAFVWRPWRGVAPSDDVATRRPGLLLDVAGEAAVGGLVAIAAVAVLTEGYVYQWLMAVVSVLSLVAVLVAVHPAALGFRTVLSWTPLVELGKRSYGLYLWHWPVFVFAEATHGSVGRVLAALAVAAVLSELCYRFVETPVRKGVLGRWFKTAGEKRLRPLAASAAVVFALAVFYANVDEFDRAAGGDAVFSAPTTPVGGGTGPVTSTATGATGPLPTVAIVIGPTTEPPNAAPNVVVVGDSQAHALAINLPDGIGGTLDISDGGLDGCSVYEGGSVHSELDGFTNTFSVCADWVDDWVESAEDADANVALVVLGAWDVFDIETPDGDLLAFGSDDWDDYVTDSLKRGIGALADNDVHIGLLEVPCMRPVAASGAGVPALPERGDDERVEHLNELWRDIADADPGDVTFIDGPDEWCDDEAIATDLTYRWDGVHVYTPGANLIYTAIAPALVDLAG